jgi:alpha-L-fucosidase
MTEVEKRTQRTRWFCNDRFGMFIHFGLYAIPARGEWVRSTEQISLEDYQQFFDEFNPVDFDAKVWAKLAKEAGMKYAVLTSKHHDGFCLYDSKLTDYKITNTPFGRDLVKEFVEAFRAEGIKVGLYYSLLDWHHPGYPAYGDRAHPMRNNEAFKGMEHNWASYVEYLHGQVREICSNYGKLDILWFDFSYDDMKGEKWKAKELVEMVRSLQPDVIIDNRLEGSGEEGGSLYTDHPTTYAGDFASPEQIIPPEGVTNQNGEPIPWEACITMNENWGYCSSDKNFKSAHLIIRKLVECVSKNGNMLLNVGPDARGRIPDESVAILKQIGKWMSRNSESIYGCGSAGLPKPEWGWYTAKGDKLYAHVLEPSIGAIALQNLGGKIHSMRLLRDGCELRVPRTFSTAIFSQHAFFNFGPGHVSYPLPDEDDSVVEIRLLNK